MPDYNLGRASGKIEITYDGSGADRAARDLDGVAASSAKADESLSRTQKTASDTDRQFRKSADSAQGYNARLSELKKAADDVEQAHAHLNVTLLDGNSTRSDIESAYDRLDKASQRHTKSVNAERDAHNAMFTELSIGQRILRSFSDIMPNLSRNVEKLGSAQGEAAGKASGLAKALNLAATAATFLGQPEISVGIKAAGAAMDKFGGNTKEAAGSVTSLIGQIAGFETAFGKISGLTLAVPAVGGLAGLAGAAGAQGIVQAVEAIRQLSGGLALLPALLSGAGFAAGTLQVAFQGVGDAIKDMMADDPKKFLEDIKNMGPAAAHSMLQIAQFRDLFKLAGGSIQDSFFAQIANDIAPLIQTWLPAVTSGMTQVAGIFGQAAHEFIGLLQQPVMMQGFRDFVDNVGRGLNAIIPALSPLVEMFRLVTVVGAKFFEQIGTRLAQGISELASVVEHMVASGRLRDWIQAGIDGFAHLANIVFNVGSAFGTIMEVADKFGGGGLLGFLDKIATQLNGWTQSSAGQKALEDFFSTLKTATDAFTPMLQPLLNGLVSLGKAFVQLGIATAPGWQVVFDTFASTMQQLGPQIASTAPAINTFLTGLATAFQQLMSTVGPQLPTIFKGLADSFVALLPQIQPLTRMFIQLVEQMTVNNGLPRFFDAVTNALIAMEPYWPIIIDAAWGLVRVLTWFLETGTGVINWFTKFFDGVRNFVTNIPGALGGIGEKIVGFFTSLPDKALQWGKDLVSGFINGIKSMAGQLIDAIKQNITDLLPDFVKKALGIQSPSRVFHDIGVFMMQGLQQGLAAGSSGVLATAAGIVGQVTSASRAGVAGAAGGGGGAPAAGGAGFEGGSLLPGNIAGADTSVLDRYLQHQFPENRGLAGLAKDLGGIVSAIQSGLNLVSQNLMQPLGQVLGMIPALKTGGWQKMDPAKFAAQQQQESQRKALEEAKKQGPTWDQVFGKAPPGPGGRMPTPPAGNVIPGQQAGNGDPALTAALQAKGFSPQLIRLIQGFSVVEGRNPAGNPTLGWTDAQLGGATDLQSHVDALAKQFQDRAPVAGPFPEKGTDLERAQWIAKVVGQNGSASDWQGNAQPKDYVERVLNAMPGAAPGAKGPSWVQITGAPGATNAGNIIAGAASAGSAPPPNGPTSVNGWSYITDPSQLSGIGVGDAKLASGGASTILGNFAQWFNDNIEPITGTAGYRQGTAFDRQIRSNHISGTALDLNPNDFPGYSGGRSSGAGADTHFTPEQIARIRAQLATYGGAIYWGNDWTGGSKDPMHFELAGASYSSGLPGQNNAAVQAAYARLTGAPLPPGATSAPGLGNTVNRPSTGYSDVDNALAQIQDNTQKSATTNDEMLKSYLAGNPDLARQIDAAKTPGANDQTVMGTLNSLSSTITDLKTSDAVGNKNTIDALTSTQSQIAQTSGFQQGASPAQMFSNIAGGAAGIAGQVIQTIQAGLDTMTATQDIADRMVYGMRNWEDFNKIIDDVQKWITLGGDIANTVGSVLSTIGGFVGAGASGDPSGGASGAAAALGAAGQIAQLIGAAYQGVNAAIDFGQQIYHIAGQYVGRFLSVMTGLNGTPLMGDVRLQLNKNTGQLIAYSADNPENKDYLHVPSWMNKTYDYNGKGNQNPQVSAQYNLYAGPGTSPGELLSAATWMTQTSGTTGAYSAANF